MMHTTDEMWKNSDIVDNSHVTLKEAFSARAADSNKEICIASGYLYVSGFLEIVDSIHPDAAVRILMGNETNFATASDLEAGHKSLCEKVIKHDLDHVPTGDVRLSRLYQMIVEGTAQVRVYTKSRFHAKLYIFRRTNVDDDKAIIGSSNLTIAGLSSNTELNVVHKGSSELHLLRTWFDDKWNEAEPFNLKFVKIVDESGKLVSSPKEFAGARELVREAASEILRTYGSMTRNPEHKIEPLAKFQNEGATMLEHSINRFGGAILSDSVGLGKTFVAMRVIENYMTEHMYKRVLIIAPRSAMNNWKSIINDSRFDIKRSQVDLRSTTQISNYDPENNTADRLEVEQLSECELIVIDEAHRFRNIGRKNRKNLEMIGTLGKRVLLITATAVNNSVAELTNLIKLFSDGTSLLNHDQRMDIEAFAKYSRLRREKVDSAELADVQLQMNLILRSVMVQRTRVHVTGQIVAGKRIGFVAPKISTYNCDSLGEKFFAEFSEMLTSVNLPHMYLVSENRNISALYKIMLYKRLESGIVALDSSLSRLVNSQRTLIKALESSNPRVAVEQWWSRSRRSGVDHGNLDDYDDEIGGNILKKIRELEPNAISKLRDSLKRDVGLVNKFIDSNIEPRRLGDGLYDDPKARSFENILSVLSDKKILVFTQSVDTACWIERILKKRQHKSYALVTGQTDNDRRNYIIERFSPRSNVKTGKLIDEANEISILVTTDTLSEAVNLQDCSHLINFDLPWNPMVMVQRVGRIDRIGNLGQTHVHNLMPNQALENFLNLVSTLQNKIGGITDTVGKEFQILTEDEIIDPKQFEQLIREHPAYTGDVVEAASKLAVRGRVFDDMTIPAQERLEEYNMEMSTRMPSVPPCIAITTSNTQYMLVAMYQIFDKTNNTPLSDTVVTAAVNEDGSASFLQEIGEDAKKWLELLDHVEHDSKSYITYPKEKSKVAINHLGLQFKNEFFEQYKNRYSRPGRKISSSIERAFLAKLLSNSKRQSSVIDTLKHIPFKDMLFKASNTTRVEDAQDWIQNRTDDEILDIAMDISKKLQDGAGFVPVRKPDNIDFKLICWCVHEPI